MHSTFLCIATVTSNCLVASNQSERSQHIAGPVHAAVSSLASVDDQGQGEEAVRDEHTLVQMQGSIGKVEESHELLMGHFLGSQLHKASQKLIGKHTFGAMLGPSDVTSHLQVSTWAAWYVNRGTILKRAQLNDAQVLSTCCSTLSPDETLPSISPCRSVPPPASSTSTEVLHPWRPGSFLPGSHPLTQDRSQNWTS